MHRVTRTSNWPCVYLVVCTIWLVSGRAGAAGLSKSTATTATTTATTGTTARKTEPPTTQASSVHHSSNRLVQPTGDSAAPLVPPANRNDRLILDTAVLDTNQDGCISGKAELEAFKQRVADALAGTPNNLLRAHSIVYRTDVNRDGRICWCDFISIYLHDKALGNRHSVPYLVLPDTVMFTQLDADHDGQLSGSERTQLEKEFESCLPRDQSHLIVTTMAELLDRDQSISREEFQEFFKIPHRHRDLKQMKTENIKLSTETKTP